MNKIGLRAVTYNRVSTEEEKQRDALARQIRENREVIGKMGWELVREYIDEGKSGTQTRHRPGYNQLFRDLAGDGFDIVVIKDQDRLMRNPKDWYLFVDCLLKNGKKLYIHLDNNFYNPDNALLTGIKAILAEEYSRHLSRKINNAHKIRQEKGEAIIITNQTWGYRKQSGGTVVIDETERAVIETIFMRYAQGIGSRLICKELYGQGIRNRRGNILAESQIRAIVRNPLYKGVAVMNKTHIDFDTKKKARLPDTQWICHHNRVPAIVSPALWTAANQIIDRNSRQTGNKKTGAKTGSHILSGKVICGECGQRFWRNQRNRHRNGNKESKASYWYCSSKANGCNSIGLKETDILDMLRQIGSHFIDSDSMERMKKAIAGQINDILANKMTGHRYERETEKSNLTGKQKRIQELLIDGILPQEEGRNRLDDIRLRLAAIETAENRYVVDAAGQDEIMTRNVRTERLLSDETYDVSVPVVAAHVEQIRIYEAEAHICLDFLPPTEPAEMMKTAIKTAIKGKRFDSFIIKAAD